ncbi:AAA family ATPase [Rathayibacter sp. Leaf248]|uniref:AAA family ATPase n=1 Tax=Rathayibacter sp. Leaf248 TaxID=2876555 RepID=UPI001E55DEF6|nr:AAA family ATPase [Rathayibacter sp. Leaf248]
MRIRRLAFAGLGPFRDPQEIDFDRLENVGIYLIAGRTGAGKSTILDAISFALYGSVPRFDGTSARLRSDHSAPEDETFAELDFEAAGRLYRIRRSPEYERPAKRGGGTTRQAAKVSLLECVGGAWSGVSSSAKETGVEIGRIVGLTKDQFLQVILLAQNRFHEFLLAKNDDRQKLLRTLFATERYELLRRRLLDQRQESAASLEEERTAVAALADEARRLGGTEEAEAIDAAWFAGLVASLEPALLEARSEVDRADDAQVEARAALDAASLLRRAQDRRSRALRESEELAVAEAVVVAQRERVELARRADGVLPVLRSAASARTAAERAAAERDGAAELFGAVLAEPAERARAAERSEALGRRLGALADALAEERRIPDAEKAVERAERARAKALASLERLEGELKELPVRLDALAAEEESLTPEAATVPSRTDELAALERRIAAAAEREAAASSLASLRSAYAEAGRRHGDLAAEHSALISRRFAGFAGELATALIPGEPCPVCGAREHPRPAEHGDLAPVSTEDLDRARAAVDAAARTMDRARDRESTAALALAALEERAGVDTPESLDLALIEGRERLAAARAAASRCEALRSERGTLRRRLDELTALRESARTDDDHLTREATIAAEALRTLLERVEAQRDGADSIAARVAELTERRRVADALVAAEDLLVARTRAADEAQEHLESVLAERGFASAASAEAAALTAGERARAEAVVAEHERRRAAVDAVLAEPELQGLPTTPVDLAGAEEAARLASARRDEARSRLSVLEHRAARLAELAALAENRLRSLEGRLRRHEELRALAETIDGRGQNTRRMDLEAFALAGRLEEIVGAANLRLGAMTSGRYSLLHDDSLAYRNTSSGLGIEVLDAFTGVRRQPASLSGGETFLASLALALGLADVVTAQSGGITLETMFIDEGFGSLDAETLETALGTLDALRSGGRTIGLISHVDAMRERLPIGLRVVVGDRGDSTLRTD